MLFCTLYYVEIVESIFFPLRKSLDFLFMTLLPVCNYLFIYKKKKLTNSISVSELCVLFALVGAY